MLCGAVSASVKPPIFAVAIALRCAVEHFDCGGSYPVDFFREGIEKGFDDGFEVFGAKTICLEQTFIGSVSFHCISVKIKRYKACATFKFLCLWEEYKTLSSLKKSFQCNVLDDFFAFAVLLDQVALFSVDDVD